MLAFGYRGTRVRLSLESLAFMDCIFTGDADGWMDRGQHYGCTRLPNAPCMGKTGYTGDHGECGKERHSYS